MTAMICPFIYFGSMFGVLLYNSFPEFLIKLIYALLLFYNFLKTVKKGIKIYKEERKKKLMPLILVEDYD